MHQPPLPHPRSKQARCRKGHEMRKGRAKLSTINVAVKGLEIMDGEDAPLTAKYFQERVTGD